MAAVSLSFTSSAQAQRIIKVKGQQAIVQFPPGITPTVGETLSTGGSSAPVDNGAGSHGSGSRDHSLTLLVNDLGVYSSSAGGSRTIFDLSGSYGWNMHTMEFGPIVTINYVSKPGETDRTLTGGGFFDFNFVPNVVGQSLIYGVGAQAQFGQTTMTIGSFDNSFTALELGLMGTVKWFGLSDHVCLRADAGFDMQRSGTSSGTTTLTGLLVRGGLAGYF